MDTYSGQSTPVTHTLAQSRLACAALRYCPWAGDVPNTHWRRVAGNGVRPHRTPPALPDQPRPAALECLDDRSEEHTSELQSLMRISYAVFCLKKKTNTKEYTKNIDLTA